MTAEPLRMFAQKDRQLKWAAPLIPYLAVLVGVELFTSAWAGILLYHLGMVVILRLAKYRQVGKPPESRRDFLVLVAFALLSAVSGLFIYLFWPVMKLEHLLLALELADLGLDSTAWYLFILYYFTVNPFLEELYWRGYLGSPVRHPVWNDFWFAGYHLLVLVRFVHLPWAVASLAVLVGAGWLWRQLVRRYDGLWIPIVSHAAADASIIGAVFLLSI